MQESNGTPNEGSSFGISKIIDVKIDEGGQQLYKVKWEATWEPAENLVACQHLIDEFWSFVNKVKNNEEVRDTQKRKMVNSDINTPIKKLSEDNKAEVQKLLARNNATNIGNGMSMVSNNSLTTPSDRLMVSGDMAISSHNHQTNMQGLVSPPIHGIKQNFPRHPQTPTNMQQQNLSMQSNYGQESSTFTEQKSGNKTPTSQFKSQPGNTVKPAAPSTFGKNSSTSTLKYIENFSNPYVKIILVCKVCSKEQSMKSSQQGHWKRHYLSHASAEDKPYKCHICPKAFIENSVLQKHLKTHEKNMTLKIEEQFSMY